jgi:hypothetical protein
LSPNADSDRAAFGPPFWAGDPQVHLPFVLAAF